MPGAAPLSADETLALLSGLLAGAEALLLAVSGGPDSVALLYLAAEAANRAAQRGLAFPRLLVGSVDHGLRPEARSEVEGVLQQAHSLGLAAHGLLWCGAKPARGLQEAAREARYRLLTELAARCGASHLATAHTADDQAETMLFRLARGSGPAGVVGMRPSVARGGLVHIRPFLAVPKARLVAACQASRWSFHDDPSNVDTRYSRSRWRRLMPDLAAEGLDSARLTTFSGRLALWQAAIDAEAAAAQRRACLVATPKTRIYALAPLLEAPAAILIRVLEQSLTDFAASGPPRLERLERLVEALLVAAAGGQPFKRSLHGALLATRPGRPLEVTHAPPRRRGLAGPSRPRPADAP